jgi:hypothetical protein
VNLFPGLANFSFQSAQPYRAPARLTTLLANLDSFTEDKSKKDEAAGEAIDSTGERNTAYVALRAYMKELKGVARGALRGKPGLRAKLEL